MNTTFVNAVPFTVIYRSGEKKGQSELIHHRELDLIEIYTWAELTHQHRTPELIALATGRPLDWVRSLSFPSAAALAEKIFELNFPNALTLLRDPVMAALLRPLLTETAEAIKHLSPEQMAEIEQQMKRSQLPGPNGSGSSSAPSPSASPAATGSESSATLPPDSAPSSLPRSEPSPATG